MFVSLYPFLPDWLNCPSCPCSCWVSFFVTFPPPIVGFLWAPLPPLGLFRLSVLGKCTVFNVLLTVCLLWCKSSLGCSSTDRGFYSRQRSSRDLAFDPMWLDWAGLGWTVSPEPSKTSLFIP